MAKTRKTKTKKTRKPKTFKALKAKRQTRLKAVRRKLKLPAGANTPSPEGKKGLPILVAGRTLTELAEACGTTMSFLARCRRGKRAPGLALYFDLIEATGLTYEQVREEFCQYAKRSRQSDEAKKAQAKARKAAA